MTRCFWAQPVTLRLSEAGLRLVDSAEAKPVCDYPLKQVPGWRLAKGEFTFQVVDDGRKEMLTATFGSAESDQFHLSSCDFV